MIKADTSDVVRRSPHARDVFKNDYPSTILSPGWYLFLTLSTHTPRNLRILYPRGFCLYRKKGKEYRFLGKDGRKQTHPRGWPTEPNSTPLPATPSAAEARASLMKNYPAAKHGVISPPAAQVAPNVLARIAIGRIAFVAPSRATAPTCFRNDRIAPMRPGTCSNIKIHTFAASKA